MTEGLLGNKDWLALAGRRISVSRVHVEKDLSGTTPLLMLLRDCRAAAG